MATFIPDIVAVLISLVISGILFIIARRIVKSKLAVLKGYNRLLILITIGIVFGESVYLIRAVGLAEIALEAITSAGVIFIVIAFALQPHLKNAMTGILLNIDSKINIGDIVEVQGQKGIVTEMWLTETLIETEDGTVIMIPNTKFAEDVVIKYKRKEHLEAFDILQSEGRI